METKRDKFVRLTEKRMENVLKGISLLGNLANTSNYDYTEADAAKIIKTLKEFLFFLFSFCVDVHLKEKLQNLKSL